MCRWLLNTVCAIPSAEIPAEFKVKPGTEILIEGVEPTLHADVAVGAIVVEDQVQGLPLGKLGVESLEKLQELLVPMPRIRSTRS